MKKIRNSCAADAAQREHSGIEPEIPGSLLSGTCASTVP
jgi:hypothetical protein